MEFLISDIEQRDTTLTAKYFCAVMRWYTKYYIFINRTNELEIKHCQHGETPFITPTVANPLPVLRSRIPV